MRTTAGFKTFPLEIDRELNVLHPADVDQLLGTVKADGITDLIVISHGWRNDENDARKLYDDVLGRIRAELDRPANDAGKVAGVDSRKYAVLEVFWPSKKSADEENIPGGAAGVGDAGAKAQGLVDEFAKLFAKGDPTIAKLRELAPHMDDDDAKRREFVQLLRKLVTQSTQGDTDHESDFFALDGAEVVKRIGRAPLPVGAPGGGGAAAIGGGAAMTPGAGAAAGGVGGFFGGLFGKVKDTLDVATYYTMKERAGRTGAGPVNAQLRKIRAAAPNLRFHLIGHSFGGRLVTAAAMGDPAQAPVGVATLTLLQAAFSHYGFSQKYDDHKNNAGFFRPVITDHRVTGPILVSHSRRDKAVGMAYPLASRLGGQQASDVGDAKSPYGGIGRNGAQKTDVKVDLALGKTDAAYAFEGGKIYNLKADDIIMEHSDIAKPEVAHAWAAAVAKT